MSKICRRRKSSSCFTLAGILAVGISFLVLESRAEVDVLVSEPESLTVDIDNGVEVASWPLIFADVDGKPGGFWMALGACGGSSKQVLILVSWMEKKPSYLLNLQNDCPDILALIDGVEVKFPAGLGSRAESSIEDLGGDFPYRTTAQISLAQELDGTRIGIWKQLSDLPVNPRDVQFMVDGHSAARLRGDDAKMLFHHIRSTVVHVQSEAEAAQKRIDAAKWAE